MSGVSGAAGPRLAVVGKDLLASLVVFFVALPLCLGVAIASGVPPVLGLVAGVVGGLVVGPLAGSPLQVSGPAAGLVVLVLALVEEHGLAMLGVVGLIAGSLQLLAGVLRLGQWFRAISPAVIQGMLAGIGVLIFASQFHVMVDDAPRAGGVANLVAIPEAIWLAIRPDADRVHQQAALAGLLTIAAILLWLRFKPRALALLPAPLVGVAAGTLLAVLLDLPISTVMVPGDFADFLNVPTPEALRAGLRPEILGLGLALAFVASAETLLCATAVDQMHLGVRTRYNKELRAQGIGNIVCGALGAMPITGVIVRSHANVHAGATTRLSAIVHGLWLALTVLALPWLLNAIPTSVLAAVLVYTGYKMVDPAQIRKIARFGLQELGIYAATLVGVVAVDLLWGVIAGFVLATLKLVYTFSHLEISIERKPGSDRVDIRLNGSATFFAIPQLASTLESQPRGSRVHLHVDRLDYIDHACLEMLDIWDRLHQSTGGALVVDWPHLVGRYSRRSARPLPIALGPEREGRVPTD